MLRLLVCTLDKCRSDLEAALKARSKLSSSASLLSSTTTATEDAKTISSLYESMKSVEVVSSQLPAIIERVHQLATLHGQAADFSTRLVAIESGVRDVERLLRSLEETLDNAEKGCIANLDIMEKNVTQLDERMKTLAQT